MEELINNLKEISNLSEIKNINSINTNLLLYAILKSGRYDLLKDINTRLNINDIDSFKVLTEFLLSDRNIYKDMQKNGFNFSNEELNSMLNITFEKYNYSYNYYNFLLTFFNNREELNIFIKEYPQFFINYLKEKGTEHFFDISDIDSFVELILKGKHFNLIRDLKNYSVSNLKLLAQIIQNDNRIILYNICNDDFAKHLIELKSEFNPNEFCELLGLLKSKFLYDIKDENSENKLFSSFVKNNLDYLIEMVSQTKKIPICLVESDIFRDECIKRGRIDLAVKCILPMDIMKNQELVNAYCKELKMDPKDFSENVKWLFDYKKMNDDIFNTFVSTSIKNEIFNLRKEHYERFINDVELQMSISKLNDREITVLSKILNLYDYKENDVSLMIVNVIYNIHNYKKLIASLNIENISEQDIKNLVNVLQLPDNQFQIDSQDSLKSYDSIKKLYFANNFDTSDLNVNKDNLLKVLFNISLDEGQYIDFMYCYDNKNNNNLEKLKNSELPQKIYNYLRLINTIIKCNNKNELLYIYDKLKDCKIYEKEIPLELFLKGKYTELYSQSLYRIDEKNKVYGPKDSISKEINYKGKKIKVCIPREKFNFLIHCVGTCSSKTSVIDKNYKIDWLYRPQLQDHFVACSYINERQVFSFIIKKVIAFGFDTLENGAILSMGDVDIDSMGFSARIYAGSRELQKINNGRARFYVPSEMFKPSITNVYNEIILERRNGDKNRSNEFKRKPDYIVMIVESMDKDNFNYLENLYNDQLSFISKEDQEIICKINNTNELEKILVKYNDIIKQNAFVQNKKLNEMVDMYVDLIMQSKYYEESLKAASEFDVPLVIVDQEHYFYRMLAGSTVYDKETINIISEIYSKSHWKGLIFNAVAQGKDLTEIMKYKDENNSKFILL